MRIHISNVRIFDPRTETLGAPSTVFIADRRIRSVEPYRADAPQPSGAVAIDGQGGTLLPGLHDVHVHHTAILGPLLLAAGVTGTRDVGNDNAFLLDFAARIESGQLPGPRIVRAGLMEGRSPYSTRMGMIPGTLGEAISDVRWYAAHGYWQIKIYNSMNPDWVKPIAAEAHRLDLHVNGHIPAFMSADRAITDGYDELTHLNQLMLSWVLNPGEDTRTPLRITAMRRAATLDLSSARVQATLALMKAHRTAFDPTTVIMERLLLARAGTVQDADRPYLDHMPIGYQRWRKRSFVDIKNEDDDRAYREAFDKTLAVLAMLDRNGIRIFPGTDDGTGFSLHRELELEVKAGIPAAKVLRMATLGPEVYFGHDRDLGTIESGKLADLILVDGDPCRISARSERSA